MIKLAVKIVPCFVTEFYSIVGRCFIIIFMKLFSCLRLVIMVNNVILSFWSTTSCIGFSCRRHLYTCRGKMVGQTVQFMGTERIVLLEMDCRG